MLLFWRGLGFLVPVVALVCTWVANLVTNALIDSNYYETHRDPLAIAILVAAVIIFFIGRYLDERVPGRILVDPETNEKVLVKRRHDFFFIKVVYWGHIMAVISFVSLYLH